MNATKVIQKNKAFLIPVLIFILTGIVFLSLYSKAQIHLTQNSWHGPISDYFFKYLTHLGDGLVFAPLALFLALIKWRYFFGLIIAAVLTLIVSAGLKHQFKEMERPVKYFENLADLHLVEGVHNHSYKSFPSGHTTTAFAAWGFLALLIRRKPWQFGLAVLAMLVGYSRIHISQHFLIDVIAGAILGSGIALFSYLLSQYLKAPWLQKGLVKK